MTWLFQSKIAKSHFYVWYLGSKEADGVRGSAVVLPAMRQLLKESFKKTPSKATVQISSKGLKLIQSVPAMSRNGKVKMQLVKFQISANCITYSITGKAPFDDVVGVVMLVLNPEMQSPMHVHCYRCDSAETAQIMHANIQLLLSRPEIQRGIMDLEHRLFLSGLLVPRRNPAASRSSSQSRQRACTDEISSPIERADRLRREDMALLNDRSRHPNMPRKVVDELRHKIHRHGEPPSRRIANSLTRYDSDFRGSLSDIPLEMKSKYRMFGDTILRDNNKSRSLDNLAEPIVSTNIRGNDGIPSPRRFPRTDLTDPFGQSYERMNTLEGFWKSKIRRTSSIKMDF